MEASDLNKRALRIKGNKDEISRLIKEYRPFIMSCASKAAGKYVRIGSDDESTIAMEAFYEAVKRYELKKGDFIPFAKRVIISRITDYLRKKSRQEKITYEDYGTDGNTISDRVDILLSDREYVKTREDEQRRLEIEELDKTLKTIGISFSDLVASSPKHKKNRLVCRRIGLFIVNNKEYLDNVIKKGRLPAGEIKKYMGIPVKKFERYRKYIIAVSVILSGEYEYLKEYIAPR